MKVTNENATFKPITIILETEAEAKLMWAKLNTSVHEHRMYHFTHDQFVVWLRSTGLDTENQHMFDTFNAQFRPSEVED